jgi:hypothetical protein
MPCLFALLGAFAPRIAVFVLWIFTPMVNAAFNSWIWPLLGVIFLPFTTLMWILVMAPLGTANFWGWLCVFLGLLIDLRSYGDAYVNRSQIPGMTTATATTTPTV